jgi:acetyltransferase-like isoleucine patch superfamily enzyme
VRGLRLALLKQVNIILRQISQEIHCKVNPVGYARRIGVRIGDDTFFYGMRPGMFGSEPFLVRIGSHCHITSGVQFITHDGGPLILRHECPDLDYTAPITIGDHIYIGFRAIILPGVDIGNNCIIGAGSVVTKSVPPNSVAAGVPARVICSLDEYLQKLKSKSTGLGNLKGLAKEAEYIKRFGVAHNFVSRLTR